MDAHQGTSYKEKMENLKSECERLGKENENLRLMLGVMSDQYNLLQSRLQKVKEEEEQFVATKPSKVFVRTNSNDKTLVVKDGFQWRKYGQKVTKDNPSPRAYFRCSMASSCPVKKKVQRSMEDECVLMVTYEGEHNHAAATYSSTVSSQLIDSSSSIKGSITSFPCSSLVATPFPPPTTGLNLTFTRPNEGTTIMPTHNLMQDINTAAPHNDYDDDHHHHNHNSIICTKIGECMAHLTKDSNFTAALAAAVANSISEQLKPNTT